MMLENNPWLSEIRDGENNLIAIIVSRSFWQIGLHFFTQPEAEMQLGYMRHTKGHVIKKHSHNFTTRTVNYTQETLFIRHGKVRADFYTADQAYLQSKILETGDIALLVSGGHGFEMLEDTEMFEVKQGPWQGPDEKTLF